MIPGIITVLKPLRGFGFIAADGQAGLRYSHFFCRETCSPGVFDGLREGQLVEFESVRDDRGLRALNVRPAERAS